MVLIDDQQEFLTLRAIANGRSTIPAGETVEERLTREARANELYRLLDAQDALPRLTTNIPAAFSG